MTRHSTTLLCAMYFTVTVLRVIDGDTFVASFPNSPNQVRTERVRVLGVDTPDRKDAARYLAAKQFTRQWLADINMDRITIHACAYDDFGRLLGRVCRGAVCLDDALITAGHGVQR